MRAFLTIACIVLASLSEAQVSLDRVLVGSASFEYNSQDMSLSASVGEPMVETFSDGGFVLTQGFQQSNFVMSNPFIVQLISTPAACLGANDGTAGIAFISDNIAEPRTYQWSTGATSMNLVQAVTGTYELTVTGANGNSVTNTVTVGAIDSVDCSPGFYIGITPNSDNFNDYWHIDNVDFFLEKEVRIFNRYGALVWSTDAYDNTAGAFNGTHRNGNPLPDGTYYYIARFDGSRYKGWIEISR